jgi:type IV fimbrial biogenesis protein FimT
MHAQRGFTLVELMVVIVIASVLAAIAFPSMAELMVGNRIRASGMDLASALLLARSEAIKRNGQVAVQPVVDSDWTQGWTVTVITTNEQIDRKAGLGVDVVVNDAPDTIVFNGNGRLTAAATARVEIADAHGRAEARCVSVDLSGMPHVSLGGCA